MAKSAPAKNPEALAEVAGNVFSGIVAVFLIVTFTIFPLYYQNYYFNILVAKYRFYFISVLVFFGICLLTALVFCFVDQMEYKGENTKRFFDAFRWKNLKKNLTVPELFMVIFLLLVGVSTLQSDYLYESFWGNEGRFSGMFLLILYVVGTILIVRLGRMKKWYLDLFLFAGLLVCLFGITDYFKMDLLHWKENVKEGQYNTFVSSIGNINSFTAYVALVVGVSAGMFASEKNIFRSFWYYLVYLVALFAIVTGQSDNAYLALGALFAFLPFVLFGSRKGTKRYAVLAASFAAVIKAVDYVNIKYADQVIGLTGIFKKLTEHERLEYIVIACWLLVAVLYIGDRLLFREKEDKVGRWLRIVWAVLIGAAVFVVVAVLYDANFGGHAERYQSYSQYLIFNDRWGTNRGYCWRIGWESYMKQPFHHKLFGFGPDTYGLLTYEFHDEALELQGVYYENAHNEYLQYLVTIGPIALAAYLMFLCSSWIAMAKNIRRKPWILAPMLAGICYGAQAFVNISVPIVAPFLWALTAVGLAMCRPERTVPPNKN